jgi:disulfide bond formation protein DsbB
MKNIRTFRFAYLSGFIVIAILLGGAFYLQNYKGMSPCPLCLLQRIAMAALGVVFIVGAIFKFNKWGNVLLGLLGLLAAMSGALLAGRQVWLQLSPPSASGGCGASLSYIFNILSIKDALIQVWQGGMECSQTGWEFLHLSLAAWSLIGFAILLLLIILQIIRAVMD